MIDLDALAEDLASEGCEMHGLSCDCPGPVCERRKREILSALRRAYRAGQAGAVAEMALRPSQRGPQAAPSPMSATRGAENALAEIRSVSGPANVWCHGTATDIHTHRDPITKDITHD